MTLYKKEKCKLMKEKTAFKMQHVLSDQLNWRIARYDLQDFLKDFELTFPHYVYLSHAPSVVSSDTNLFYVRKISGI